MTEELNGGPVTSAFGPMKRSPSRAPAMTRMCLGRPTLQGHRRSVSWAGAWLNLHPGKLQPNRKALEGGQSKCWEAAQGKDQTLDLREGWGGGGSSIGFRSTSSLGFEGMGLSPGSAECERQDPCMARLYLARDESSVATPLIC